MQYVIPQEQQQYMVVPQEQYPMQYMVQPQPEVIAVPYGCGSCKSSKFGGGKKGGRLSSHLAAGLADPYNNLADSLAKSRITNPILHGVHLKTAKRRKYGGGKKSKARKPKSPMALLAARRRRAVAAAKRRRFPSPRYY
jgi:hypothetical protein